MDGRTAGQPDRQTDRRRDRQTNRQTGRQMDKSIETYDEHVCDRNHLSAEGEPKLGFEGRQEALQIRQQRPAPRKTERRNHTALFS